MIVIERSTLVHAPAQVCFDLARDVDDHVECMKGTGERVVGGRMSGLLELGDTMTLEARHFGIRFRMTAKITEMDEPCRFVDEMESGPFKSIWHVHLFAEKDGSTRMSDRMKVEAPFGPLGLLAERLIIKRKLASLIKTRHTHIKKRAESVAQR